MDKSFVPVAVLVFALSFALALGLFFWRLYRREKLKAIEAQERLKEIEDGQRRAYFTQTKFLNVSKGETVGRGGDVKMDLFLDVMPPTSQRY